MNRIALCRMFSGAYWDDPNNIGYESINMFLPDDSENISYMYFPANGDYDFKNNDVKYVILTQHISKKTKEIEKTPEGKKIKTTSSIVKVIGLAEVCNETLKEVYKKLYPEDEKCLGYKCIFGGKEFDDMIEVYLSNDQTKKELYEKAKILSKIHDEFEVLAEGIKYSGKSLKDLFRYNESFGVLNILYTVTVKNLQYPKGNIYLTNNLNEFSTYTFDGDRVIEIGCSPSSQRQTTYLDLDEKLIEELRNACEWERAKQLNIEELERGFEPSFLTLINKENDELAYSNLFSHFFKYQEFASFFFKELDESLNIEGILTVSREEKNIDIVVKTSDYVIVIENKIKSALNGHPEEDVNGEIFKDQLVRYYKYIESEYSGKEKRYYIFSPDYNPINKEYWGEYNGDKMDKFWKDKPYSKILDIFKKFNGFKGTTEEWNYNEFVKALEVHTVKDLNNHRREMQIRMSRLFED